MLSNLNLDNTYLRYLSCVRNNLDIFMFHTISMPSIIDAGPMFFISNSSLKYDFKLDISCSVSCNQYVIDIQ